MVLESTATTLSTETRLKSITKQQAMEVYVPLSVGFYQGKVPQAADQEIENIHDTLLDRWRPVYDKEIAEKFGDDATALKQHFEWAAKRLGLEGDIPEVDVGEMFEVWTDLLWEKIEPKLRNPGLTQFTFESDAATDSLAFWTFLIAAPSGAAIEAAYGYVLDVFGIYRKIDPSDALLLWTKGCNPEGCDAGFGYQPFRDDHAASAICAQHAPGQKIVIFGGGWVPELHFPTCIGENLSVLSTHTITVYDNDPKIDPELIVSHLPEELQPAVDYRTTDIVTGLTEQAKANGGQIDLIVLKGVASFMLDNFLNFMMAAMQLLKPGGRLVVDFQLKHYTMVRDACLFGWGGGDSKVKMELMTEAEAKEFVKKTLDTTAGALGYKVKEDFSWNSYVSSTKDDAEDPVGLIYTIKRP